MKLYVFRTVPVSIIRSFSLYTQQWYMSYMFADSFWAGSGWKRVTEALRFGALTIFMAFFNNNILIIKPTRCNNFSNLFLEWNSTCFRQFLCPSWVFHCTHSKPVWHKPLPRAQWKTPDDGQRNCPKHVEFLSKNKFEKLVHILGFIIRIYHDAPSLERKIQ